jgi:spermidine synthase
MADVVTEVDRRTEGSSVYALQRRGEGFDILIDGQVAMRSTGPRVEHEVVDLALAPWETRDDVTVLLGGLGMGLMLRALLDKPQVKQVDVIEHSPTVVAWAGEELAPLNGGATRDKRAQVITRELADWLRTPQSEAGSRPGGYFVLILDTDVWPESLSRPENVELYHEDGLLLLETALRPGGVLVLCASRRDDELDGRLRKRYQSVARVVLPTEIDGESRLYYVYRGRRSSVGGGEG